MLMLKTAVGVALMVCLWPAKAALAAAKAMLRPASGVLAALAALADKAVRNSVQDPSDPSELIDGRVYVFRHRSGVEVGRTFYRSRSAAVSCPEDAFILEADPSTKTPGIRCFQKWLPSGEPTEASVWINMDCLFGGPLTDTALKAA